MKQVTYTRDAIRTLKKMPKNESARIRQKVRLYAADPKTQENNVKRLQGSSYYRLRVGDWRVIFSETMEVIAVLDVGARGGIYG